MLEALNVIQRELWEGKRQTSAVSRVTLVELRDDGNDAWSNINAEVEGVGVPPASVAANQEFIRGWIGQVIMEEMTDQNNTACIQKIQDVFEEAVMGSSAKGPIQISVSVFWGLEEFLHEEFSTENKLSSVLTITGSDTQAWAATCQEYVKENWPDGLTLLQVIEEAIANGPRSKFDNDGVTIALMLQHNLPKGEASNDKGNPAAQVDIDGPASRVGECVKTLAWLVASLRITNIEGLSLSEVTLHHLRTQPNDDQIRFNLRLCDLRPATSQPPLCWHKLFGQAVIASGFPLPVRNEGVGLEIAASAMIDLAGIICEAEHESRQVLTGLSTMLIPTRKVESEDAIQWHLFTEDKNPLRSQPVELSPEWMRTDDIRALCKKRAFLGWCDPAIVTLGTEKGDYENIDYGQWTRLPMWKRITGFSIATTTSILAFLGLSFSTQFAIGKRMRGHYWDINKDLRERLVDLQNKPVLLYDRKAKRAWLVPVTSTLLHMAHTLAQHRKRLEEPLLTSIPYAKEGRNGGKMAWEAMKGHLDDDIGTKSNSETLKFREILLRFILGLQQATRKTQEIMKDEPYSRDKICCFEFMDIVIAEPPFIFNRHPIQRTAGQWTKIADAIDVVLCCDGLGNAILPRTPELRLHKLCDGCREAPLNMDYLAALVRCVNSLQGGRGGRPDVTQITDQLHWNRKPNTLFLNCLEQCHRPNLQTLDGIRQSPAPHGEDLTDCDGAVLFGKSITLKISRKDTAAISVAVTFCELVTTTYGQTIKIVGGDDKLGKWDTNNAVVLSAVDYTSNKPLWFITIEFAAGTVIQYKYINVASDGAVTWENAISNRTYIVPATCETGVRVINTWGES